MIKIFFSFETDYGKFQDALYLPDDHGLSDAEIEAMKQQRLTNWLAVLEAPPEFGSTLIGPITTYANPVHLAEDSLVFGQLTRSVVGDSNGQVSYWLDGPPISGLNIDNSGAWIFNAGDVAYQHLSAGQIYQLSVKYRVNDLSGASDSETLLILVVGTNDVPVATYSPLLSVFEGGAIYGQLTSVDVDLASTTVYQHLGAPLPGLTISNSGQWSFNASDPAYQWLGDGQPLELAVSYGVIDDQGAMSTGEFTILVTGTSGFADAGETIDLGVIKGVNLRLINPVQSNGKTYYFLDASPGDSYTNDYLEHQQLDDLLNNGTDTTDTPLGQRGVDDARSIVVGDYTLVLPTRQELQALFDDPSVARTAGGGIAGWSPYQYWSSSATAADWHSTWYGFLNGSSGAYPDYFSAAMVTFQVIGPGTSGGSGPAAEWITSPNFHPIDPTVGLSGLMGAPSVTVHRSGLSEIGAMPGDFVRLEQKGSFRPDLQASSSSSRLAAVFIDADGSVVAPDTFIGLADVYSKGSQGLSGQIYSGYFDSNSNRLAWFDTAVPRLSTSFANGTVDNISIGDFGDQYSIRYVGYFRPVESGAYGFQTTSDDASYVWMGRAGEDLRSLEVRKGLDPQSGLVVGNSGWYGPRSVVGATQVVEAGQIYPIVINFGEDGGGGSLSFEFKGPGQNVFTSDLTGQFFTEEGLGSLSIPADFELAASPVLMRVPTGAVSIAFAAIDPYNADNTDPEGDFGVLISRVTPADALEAGEMFFGGAGDDSIRAGAGNDSLYGGDGRDTLLGEAGDDAFFHGPESDWFDGGEQRRLPWFLWGGDYDRIDYSDSPGIVVDLGRRTVEVAGEWATDRYRGVEELRGGLNAPDRVFGRLSSSPLEALEGGASISLILQGGNDTVDGSVYGPEQFWSMGPAVHYSWSGSPITAVFAGNWGMVGYGSTAGGQLAGVDTLKNIRTLGTTAFDDLIDLHAATTSNLGYAMPALGDKAPFNVLLGFGGQDTLRGNGATLADFSAVDQSSTGQGVSISLAGLESNAVERTVNLSGLQSSGVTVGSLTFSGLVGVIGTRFSDTLTGGAREAEFFNGGPGDDWIDGGAGYDRAEYGADSGGITVRLAVGTVTTTSQGTDSLRGIEAVAGSAHGDLFDATGFVSSGSGAQSGAINVGNLSGALNEFRPSGGQDTVIGNGNTRLSYENSMLAVVVDLAAGIADASRIEDRSSALYASVGRDVFSGVSAVRGSSYDDSLFGGDTGRTTAGSFIEVLEGAAGNDLIDGRDGLDYAAYVLSPGGIEADLRKPSDQVQDGWSFLDPETGLGGVWYDTLLNIEGIQGSAYDDTVIGGSTALYVVGGRGADRISASTGPIEILFTLDPGAVVVNLAGAVDGSRPLSSGFNGAALDGWGSLDLLLNVSAVEGSPYADLITGGASADSLDGRAGNDTLDGGDGIDLVEYDNASFGVKVDLSAGLASDDGLALTIGGSTHGVDVLRNIENVLGGMGNDSISGDGLTNRLDGGAGNDTLRGGAGGDILLGGLGNDWLYGGDGSDKLVGGEVRNLPWLYSSGDYDRIDYSATAGVQVDLTQRSVTVSGESGSDTFDGVEEIRGATGRSDLVTGMVARDSDDAMVAGRSLTIALMGGSDRVELDPVGFQQPWNDGVSVLYFWAQGGIRLNYSGDQAQVTYDAIGSQQAGVDTLVRVPTVGDSPGSDLFDLSGATRSHRGTADPLPASWGWHTVLVGRGGDDTVTGNGYTFVNFSTPDASTSGQGVQVDLGAQTTTVWMPHLTTLGANAGSVTLSGIRGVIGSNFADTLLGGGAGEYEYFRGGGGDDSIVGGSGFDRAAYSGAGGIQVMLAQGLVYAGSLGTDTLRSIEAIDGSAGDDKFDATGFGGSFQSGANTGSYWWGLNAFDASAGGSDTIIGNGSTRVVYDSAMLAVRVDLGQGYADARLEADLDKPQILGIGRDTLSSVYEVRGSAYDDELIGGGAGMQVWTPGLEVFSGGAGNDLIDGRGGFDLADYRNSPSAIRAVLQAQDSVSLEGETPRLSLVEDGWGAVDTLISIEGVRGSAFADTFVGSSADERFDGGNGSDSIRGGGGLDRSLFTLDPAGVTVLLSAASRPDGQALPSGWRGYAVDGWGSVDLLAEVEGVEGSAFGDFIVGDERANRLDGRGGADTIDGGAGVDWVEYDQASSGVVVDLLAKVAEYDGQVDGSGAAQQIYEVQQTGVLPYWDNRTYSFYSPDKGSAEFGLVVSGPFDSIEAMAEAFRSLPNYSISPYTIDSYSNHGASQGDGLRLTFKDGGDYGLRQLERWGDSATPLTVVAEGSGSNSTAGARDVLTHIENVLGSAFADHITGSGDDNVFQGGAGDDTLIGGKGIDTARYSGTRSDYEIQPLTDGSWTVRDLRSSSAAQGATAGGTALSVGSVASDGKDLLYGIERLQFVDGREINLSLAASMGDLPGSSVVEGGEQSSLAWRTGLVSDWDVLALTEPISAVKVQLDTNSLTAWLGGGSQTLDKTYFGVEQINGSTGSDAVLGVLAGGTGLQAQQSLRFSGFGGGDVIALDVVSDDPWYEGVVADYRWSSEGLSARASGSTISVTVGQTTASALDTLIHVGVLRDSTGNDRFDLSRFTENAQGKRDAIVMLGGGSDTVHGNGDTAIGITATISDQVNAGVYIDLKIGRADLSGLTNAGADTAFTTAIGARLGTIVFSGVDALYGTPFNDTLVGGLYDDRESFRGGAGDDRILGAAGLDWADYRGSTEPITVHLGAGTVSGGPSTGSDSLRQVEAVTGTMLGDVFDARGFSAQSQNSGDMGASGRLNLFEPSGGNDTIYGNGATRLVYGLSMQPVWVDLAEGYADAARLDDREDARYGTLGRDVFSGVSGVSGSLYADELIGGGSGDGSPGTNAEFFEGQRGADLIDGRGGFDIASYASDPAAVEVDLSLGRALDGYDDIDTLISIEEVVGSAFGDLLLGRDNSGASSADVFEGGAGNDSIAGRGGFDKVGYTDSPQAVQVTLDTGTELARLNLPSGEIRFTGKALDGRGSVDLLSFIEGVEGSAFNDLIVGDSIENRLDGRAGGDTLDGGAGSDWAEYDNALAGVTVSLIAGTRLNNDGEGGRDLLLSIENLHGSAFADRLFGNIEANLLQGGSGNDRLFGYEGADVAVYSGRASDYTVSDLGNGEWRVSDLRPVGSFDTGRGAWTDHDGTDILRGIELIRFSDLERSLSLESRFESIVNLPVESVKAMNVASLTVDQMKALAPEQVAEFDPAQVKSLTATQLGAIEAADMSALTTAQFGVLSSAQIKGLLPAQVGALSLEIVRGLDAARLAQLSSGQIGGLSAEQTEILTSTQVRLFNSGQIQALSPSQIQALPQAIIPLLLTSQIAALRAEQVNALGSVGRLSLLSTVQTLSITSTQLLKLDPSYLPQLTADQIRGLSKVQLTSLGSGQWPGFEPSQIAVLGTGQLALLSTQQVAALTSRQLGAMGGTQIAALSTAQIRALDTDDMQALSQAHLSALSSSQVATLETRDLAMLSVGQIAGLSSLQVRALASAQMAVLSPAQIAALDSEDFAALSSAQLRVLGTQQVRAIEPVDLAAIGVGGMATIGTAQLAALTPAQLAALTTAQVLALGSSHFRSLAPSQIALLGDAQVRAMESSDFAGLSTAQVAALTLNQIAAIETQDLVAFSTSHIASLSPRQVLAMTTFQMASLRTQHIRALDTDDMTALSAPQLRALTTLQVASLEASDLAALSLAQVRVWDTQQLRALSTTQLRALEPEDFAALSLEQVVALSSAQIAALESSDIQALQTGKIASLGSAQVSAMMPSQLQALTSSQIKALETVQMQVLGTRQLQAFTGVQMPYFETRDLVALGTRQVQALTTGQVVALGTDQVQALQTSQIAALLTTQVQSLRSDQVASLSEAQIVALSSAQFLAFSGPQISSLTTAQVAAIETRDLITLTSGQVLAMTVSQLAAMRTSQIAALSTAQIRALEANDIASLDTLQLRALTTVQIAALETQDLAALDLAQVRALSTTQVRAMTSTQIAAIPSGSLTPFGYGQPAPILDTGGGPSDTSNAPKMDITGLAAGAGGRMIVGWSSDSKTRWLEIDSAGRAQRSQEFYTGLGPAISFAQADLDGDGAPEAIISGSGGAQLVLRYSSGEQRNLDALSPVEIDTGDVNADHKIDLVTANAGSSSFSVFTNINGHYLTRKDFGLAGSATAIAVSDLNQDGQLDVVVAYQLGTVASGTAAFGFEVWAGDGQGEFNKSEQHATNFRIEQLETADLNLDGWVDLVMAPSASANSGSVDGGVRIFLGGKSSIGTAAIDPHAGVVQSSGAVTSSMGSSAYVSTGSSGTSSNGSSGSTTPGNVTAQVSTSSSSQGQLYDARSVASGGTTIGGSTTRIIFQPQDGNDTIVGNGDTQVSYGSTARFAIEVNLGFGYADALNNSDRIGPLYATMGRDVMLDVSRVQGSTYADRLVGGGAGSFNSLQTVSEYFDPGAGDDTIDGQGGVDLVDYSGSGQALYVDMSLAEGQAQGAWGSTDTLINIELIYGTSEDDIFLGSSSNPASGSAREGFMGRAGADWIAGRDGLDATFYMNDPSGVSVYLDKGSTQATRTFSAETSTTTTFEGYAVDGWGNMDYLSSIEQIEGSGFDDKLYGGARDERFDGRGGNDTIDGGAGIDWVEYNNAWGGTTVTLGESTGSGSALDGFGGTDQLVNIENVLGSIYDDSITGNSSDNQLQGGAGNDTLDGLGGSDTAIYKGGRDRYVVTPTTDGFQVRDLLTNPYFDAQTGEWVIAEGTDTLRNIESLGFGDGSTLALTGWTVVAGATSGNDSLGAAPNSSSDLIFGGAGNDTLTGDGGNDWLVGGDGNDILKGGDGNDVLEGGLGDDTFYPGAGDDLIQGAEQRSVYWLQDRPGDRDTLNYSTVTDGGIKLDLSAAKVTGPASVGTDTYSGIEWIIGTSSSDIVSGRLGRLADPLAQHTLAFQGRGGSDLITQELYGNEPWFNAAMAWYSWSTTGITASFSGDSGTISYGAGGGQQAGTDTLVRVLQIMGTNFDDSIDFSGVTGSWLPYRKETVATITGGSDIITGNGSTWLVINATSTTQGSQGANIDLTRSKADLSALKGPTGGQMGTLTYSGVYGLIGSVFNDTLSGGLYDANEQFRGQGGDDTIDGRSGFDRADYRGATEAIRVNLADGVVFGGNSSGTDTLLRVEAIRSTVFDDTYDASGFSGNSANAGSLGTFNAIESLGGDDLILGNGATRVMYEFSMLPIAVDLQAGYSDALVGSDKLTAEYLTLGRDTFSGVYSVRGSVFGDWLVGGGQGRIDDPLRYEEFEGSDGDDIIQGMGGWDIASYQFDPGAIEADLEKTIDQVFDGFGHRDTLQGIEHIRGSSYSDLLIGRSSHEGLQAGFEALEGGNGADWIVGRAPLTKAVYVNDPNGISVKLSVDGQIKTVQSQSGESFLLTGMAQDGWGNIDYLRGIDGVEGSAHDDELFGDSADNRLDGRGGNDSIDGGAGSDWVEYNNQLAGVTVDLSLGAASDGAGGEDRLLNIENIQGSAQADRLIGDAGANRFEGLGGDDLIRGGAGIDVAQYRAARQDYSVEAQSDGSWRVSQIQRSSLGDANGGGAQPWDGNDTLESIEQLVFGDGEVMTLSLKPIFSSPSAATVLENVSIDQVVYDATASNDQNVSYTLSGVDASLFRIAPETGKVRFLASPDYEWPLDRNEDNVYEFEVIVVDSLGESASQSVSLVVTDVDERSALPLMFGEPIVVTPGVASDIAIADLNGDGIPDLALAHLSINRISILGGDGRSGFAPLQTIELPLIPSDIAAIDIDSNGQIELFVASASGPTYMISAAEQNAVISGLTSSQVASLTTSQVRALTSTQLQWMLPEHLRALSSTQVSVIDTADIAAMRPLQFAALTTSALRSLGTAQIRAMEPLDFAGLSGAQTIALSSAQIAALEPSDLAGLRVDQVAALTTAQMTSLQSVQVRALTHDQVMALTTAQAGALSSAQLAALKTEQLGWLETDDLVVFSSRQLQGLSSSQIAALTPLQVRALSSAQVSSLSSSQIRAFTTEQLMALTPAEIVAMVSAQFAALNTVQLPVLTARQIPRIETRDLAALNSAQIVSFTSAQVSWLTTNQLSALGTAQVRALESEDLAALSSAQLQSLSTAQAVAIEIGDIRALNTVQIRSLTTAQVRSLTSAQVLALEPSAFGVMSVAQISALSTAQIGLLETGDILALGTAQIDGLSTAQFAALTTAQIASLRSDQLVALGSENIAAISSRQLAALSGEQLVKIEAADLSALSTRMLQSMGASQIAALTVEQWRALSSSQLAALSTQQISVIGVDKISQFKTGQLTGLLTAQVQALTSAQVQALNSDQVKTLSSQQIRALSTAQLVAVDATELALVSSGNIQALSSLQIASLTTQQVRQLTTNQIAALSSAQTAALSPASVGGLSTQQVQALGSAQLAALTSAQISRLRSDQIVALGSEDVRVLGSAQVQALSPAQIAWIEPSDLAGFTTRMMPALTSSQIAALSTEQWRALSSSQISALNSLQLSTLDSSKIAALGSLQILGLTSSQIGSLSPSQIHALEYGQIQGFNSTQVRALTTLQIPGIDPFEIAAIGSAPFQALSTQQIVALTVGQMPWLGVDQLRAMSTAQVGALQTTDLLALRASQFEALSPTQIRSLSTAQVAALPATGQRFVDLRPFVSDFDESVSDPASSPRLELSLLELTVWPSGEELDGPGLTITVAPVLEGVGYDDLGKFPVSELLELIDSSIDEGRSLLAEEGRLSDSELETLGSIALGFDPLREALRLTVSEDTYLQIVSLGASADVSQTIWTGPLPTEPAAGSLALPLRFAASVPVQFEGISTTQIAALSSSQVRALSSVQLQALNASQLIALQSTQLLALGTHQVTALRPEQIGVIEAGDLVALTTAQLNALRPEQVASLTAQQLRLLSTQQITAVSSSGIRAMELDQIVAFTTSQTQALTSVQVTSLRTDQLEVFGLDDVAVLGVRQVQSLSPEQFASFDSTALRGLTTRNVQALSSAQLSALSVEHLNAFTSQQIAALASQQLAGLQSVRLPLLSPAQISALTSSQIPLMSSLQIRALTEAQIGVLSPGQFKALTTVQIPAIEPEEVPVIGTLQWQSLGSAQVAALTSLQVAKLETVQLRSLTTTQVRALEVQDMPVLSVGQIQALTTAQIEALETQDFLALDSQQVAALLPAQLAALSTAHFMVFSADRFFALSSSQLREIETRDLAVLNSTQFAALDSAQFGTLKDTQIRALSTAQVRALSLQSSSYLTSAQISAMTSLQMQALTADQLRTLNSLQISALNTDQIKAFGSAQVASIDPEALKALPVASLVAMSTTQVRALTAQQIPALTLPQIAAIATDDLASLSSAQIPVLSSSQLGALSSSQVIVLTTQQLSWLTEQQIPSLDPQDLRLMSTRQLAALSSSQVCALSSEQLGALSSTQLSVMKSFTPLALDLNGDGVKTLALANGTRFDLDADGLLTPVGWISSQDALLARDLNDNGLIDNGRELFGAATVLPDGSLARDGFQALAALDSNADGRIDQGDATFDSLLAWRDSNADGLSSPGELLPLAALGIQSLGVAGEVQPRADQGNVIGLTGQFTGKGGATGELVDVWLLAPLEAPSDPAAGLAAEFETFESLSADRAAGTDRPGEAGESSFAVGEGCADPVGNLARGLADYLGAAESAGLQRPGDVRDLLSDEALKPCDGVAVILTPRMS